MRLISIAAASLNQTPLDWEGNGRRIRSAIAAARRAKVDLLCLPEMCLSGYGCEDMFLAPGLRREARALLQEVLPETRGMVVCFGLPVLHEGALFNCAAMAVDGKLVALVAKQHLAGDGLHYEPRWFAAWPEGKVDVARLDGIEIPIGDLVIELDDVRVGFEICEDAWVADRPGGQLSARGVDILLNPSASHFAIAKQAERHRYVLEGSRAFGVGYLYCGPVGNEAGRAIYDGGNLIASEGELVARSPRFGFGEFTLDVATIDLDANRSQRSAVEGHHPLIGKDAGRIQLPFEWQAATMSATMGATPSVEAWEQSPQLEFEEFTRSIALGLFDYCRKSHSRGFVISLSGGADSAACALLVQCMVRLGRSELGNEEFARRLGRPELALLDERQTVAALLTTAYQATENSGTITRNAARELAEGLGATHHEFEVGALVENYIERIEGALGRELSWEKDDLALQNIQARVRAPGIWMLANIEGKLLLSTSNRSEAAVGYATMDGDTAGGLAPIAGIDKDFLRRWLRWMEEVGPDGLESTAALHGVNAQEPTAELRPAGQGQTDESDLMPYEWLERIEELAISGRLAPVEILERLAPSAPDLTTLVGWIRRFFTLWARNQWKRERYAPSFHVDERNLDPRSWYRFPILSGGFERELERMDQRARSLQS